MIRSISYFVLCLTVSQVRSYHVPTHVTAWICEDGECIPYSVFKHFEPTFVKYLSVEVCRLTCGSFGSLWPAPTGPRKQIGEGVVVISHSVKLSESTVNDNNVNFMRELSRIFLVNIGRKCAGLLETKEPYTLTIETREHTGDMELDVTTDEKYHLQITQEDYSIRSVITGGTVYGVRHGLETLSQLIVPVKNRTHCKLYIAANVDLDDAPAYPHRGVMLDTSKHYLPLDSIKRTIFAMGASKLNVLHWHMTDTQSFPFKSLAVPQMAQYGAYSEEEVYTVEDINNLVMFAQYYGVRIIPEIGGPAHAGRGWQWGEQMGQGRLLLCNDNKPWKDFCNESPCGHLNPANENVYTILGKLFKELQSVVDSGVVHLGGREVNYNCWRDTNETLDWIHKNGLMTESSTNVKFLLWSYFYLRSLQEWDKAKGNNLSKAVLWFSSLIDFEELDTLDHNRFIIEVPIDQNKTTLPENLISKNFSVILAYEDKFTAQEDSWMKIYDSYIYGSDSSNPKGVLGGEFLTSTFMVDDSSLDLRIWPKAAIVAEKFWSNPKSLGLSVMTRFHGHREELVKRGIKADLFISRWCYLNPIRCVSQI